MSDNEEKSTDAQEHSDDLSEDHFKKPDLVVAPKRIKQTEIQTIQENVVENQGILIKQQQSYKSKIENPNPELNIALPYTEPSWGGEPVENYKFEILKSGMIIEIIKLSHKSFFTVGRLPNCDICLTHPTISRYHAIIQYRKKADDQNDIGMYMYDLSSTHGSYWNGNRIKAHTFVRIRGGHMVKFGCSQRKFILQAPSHDIEEESELSLTELKAQKENLLKEKSEITDSDLIRENLEEQREEGIDWGLGEDANEETDLTENPYAVSNNEELFLDDPKKTLRGWFEREGYDLQYNVEDKGIGRFLCSIDLPIDSNSGQPIRAEVMVTGKKKEAVVQCALEACRILDRLGLLKQSHHESRKRKTKNWEEDDYYDSDEDNFLDRTGTVEKKREQRMQKAGKLNQQPKTYSSLLKDHKSIQEKIKNLEETVTSYKAKIEDAENPDADPLDAFMCDLELSTLHKADLKKIKTDLINLHKEEAQIVRLLNIAKPANLPSIKIDTSIVESSKDLKASKLKIGNDRDNSLLPKIIERIQSQKELNKTSKNKSIPNVSCPTSKTCDNSHSHLSKKPMKSQESKLLEAHDKNTLNETKKDLKESCSSGENYSTWIFPENETGDGRTALNDKYGY